MNNTIKVLEDTIKTKEYKNLMKCADNHCKDYKKNS